MGDSADRRVDFRTEPARYQHWRIELDGPLAKLVLDVNEQGSLFNGCTLKLNSYDLGVDIELADAIQRLRFEHPEVCVVAIVSGKDRVFCAGANIRMLATASHRHKVNFCKFTNETRNSIEDATAHSGQRYVSLIEGTAAGGGYELALATDWIILADDGSSAVALPEVPFLAVLPGTGGLTRVVDKRRVRRDLADVFCTLEEGVKGERALKWKLVDELAPRSQLTQRLARLVTAAADGPSVQKGVPLPPIQRRETADGLEYPAVRVELADSGRSATLTVRGPESCPACPAELAAEGGEAWALRAARELDDALLHLRFNQPELAVILLKTAGDPVVALAYDSLLADGGGDWFVREVQLLWARVLKRLDLTACSLAGVIEPGSCFAGTLAELALAADRSYMLDGELPGVEGEATLALSAANLGWYPATNGLTRLRARFGGDEGAISAAEGASGRPLDAAEAERLGLITFAVSDIDWQDDLRLFVEERLSFSPDALTGMEANLRFAGPETMETKVFGRLTAWQNWIFQRPNAVGPEGALQRYGTGQKHVYDVTRV
ncbi:MAG: benzoyl-CoA-dihydrodiol lyase [Chloroflexi bacterium]|nr:benzoyl-CoA-dihydrodiol lyase [Chloroflexota bacterium]